MKKNLRSLLSLTLAAAMLLLPACGKEEDDPAAETGETVEKTSLLTHVFRGNGITLPENCNVNNGIAPSYDAESGELTLSCYSWEEILDDEGNFVDGISHNYLMTFDRDGNLTDQTELKTSGNLSQASLSGDTMVYLTEDYDFEADSSAYYLHRTDLATGETVDSDDLVPLFSGDQMRPWFYINSMCVDGDGWIYLNAEQEILVTDENFVKQFSIYSSDWINTMAVSPDGQVYVTSFTDGGMGVFPIDKAKKALGEPHTLKDDPNQLFFGKDHDLYYTTENGVSALDFAKDGESEDTVTVILDYLNSDLPRSSTEVYAVIDSETILMGVRDSETYQSVPGVYRKSADIDLSAITTIELAYASYLSWELPEKIVAFNRAHDGVKVIVTDYSQYNTEENYSGGVEKLTRDMVNGLYKPDLILCNAAGEMELIRQIAENGLYTDLVPMLESDPDLSYDDLFGSVKRSLSDEEGRLWGIPTSVSAQTLSGRTDLLGGRTSWTFSEMLDFAESLPEGVQLFENLTQMSAAYLLLGDDGYGVFMDQDAKTCSFDSPDFIRYLKYLATLPKENDMTPETRADYEAAGNRYLPYHNGQIVLSETYLYGDMAQWLQTYGTFGTTEITRIGYPHEPGQPGSRLQLDNIYVISSSCEHPGEAWSFLRTLLLPVEDHRGMMDMPAFRSRFIDMAEEYYTYEFEVYFDGGMSWGPADPDYPKTQEDLTEPGMLLHFTEADTEAMLDFFENQSGLALTQSVSGEIYAIVSEEITSYLGGTRTAEECAKLIQSRVSLWMAEHE